MSVRLISLDIACFTYLHATVLQTAIVWIGISRHWKEKDLSAHAYACARWLFPLMTTYQIVVLMHVVESSIVVRARGSLSRRFEVSYIATTIHLAKEGVVCLLPDHLNHECGIIRSRHRERSNFIDWVCSRWSEHIRWQSIEGTRSRKERDLEGTRSRKERDLAHHAGTRSRKAFPYVLDRVPSEIAFLTYNCM